MLVVRRLSQLAAWILLVAIVVLSIVPAEERPVTPLPHDLEHFGIFVLTGAAFGFGYSRYALPSVGLLVFTGAIEIIQKFIPGRHARLSDFMVDAVSICFGVFLGALPSRIISSLSEGSAQNDS